MKDKENFKTIREKIKKRENLIPRNFKTMGGMWTVDTYEKNGIRFQLMDEGYTSRIFVMDELDVCLDCNDNLKFYKGDENKLREVASRLSC